MRSIRWILSSLLICCVGARKKSPPPLRGFFYSHGHDRQSSVCEFGRSTFELEEIWQPDLGPPFGVMHCIQCECVPVHRKRRVVGRVRCRDIKRDCPKPTCKEPVLLEGQCCKTCVTDKNIQKPRSSLKIEEEKSGKAFVALLSSPANSTLPSTPVAASGRFTLRRRTLYFSFHYVGMHLPRCVVFLDVFGNIVEELKVVSSQYELETTRLCGRWQPVSRRYRRQLRRETLSVALAKDCRKHSHTSLKSPESYRNHLITIGTIKRYKGGDTEVFSSLLLPTAASPPSLPFVAGTALLSLSLRPAAVHLTLVLRRRKNTATSRLRLLLAPVDHTSSIINETITLRNNIIDDVIELSAPTSPQQLKHMSRGYVKILVFASPQTDSEISVAGGGALLHGAVMPRFTCNQFYALLSPNDVARPTSAAHHDKSEMSDSRLRVEGVAVFSLWNNASLRVTIKLPQLPASVQQISLVGGGSRTFVVKQLRPFYSMGWINTTLTTLTARDVSTLLGGRLQLRILPEPKITVGLRPLALRGPLKDVQFPYLLQTQSQDAGIACAWMAVDSRCTLHFSIETTGVDSEMGLRVQLLEHLNRGDRLRLISEMNERATINTIRLLPSPTLYRLHSGGAQLQLISKQGSSRAQQVFSSPSLQINVPKSCLPKGRMRVAGFFQDQIEYETELETSQRCVYQGLIFDDGAQWDASHRPCAVCYCSRGRVNCLSEPCPNVTCPFPVQQTDSCCPVCRSQDGGSQWKAYNSQISNQSCTLAGRSRPVGSAFHPFLPPNGFHTCVTCYCQMGNDTSPVVSCRPKECPRLNCPGREKLPQPGACCRHCAPVPSLPSPSAARSYSVSGSSSVSDQVLGDEAKPASTSELLTSGGCKQNGAVHANGHWWHPRIATIGILPCYVCRCRDGKVFCHKQKCSQLACRSPDKMAHQCCLSCFGQVRRGRRYIPHNRWKNP